MIIKVFVPDCVQKVSTENTAHQTMLFKMDGFVTFTLVDPIFCTKLVSIKILHKTLSQFLTCTNFGLIKCALTVAFEFDFLTTRCTAQPALGMMLVLQSASFYSAVQALA